MPPVKALLTTMKMASLLVPAVILPEFVTPPAKFETNAPMPVRLAEIVPELLMPAVLPVPNWTTLVRTATP